MSDRKEMTGRESGENGWNTGKSGDGRIVLCGANSYEQKYYFNPDFNMLPKSVQEELHILCVLYTEDVGGIFTIIFEPDGGVTLETTAAEEDFLYDEVSSGLLLGEIRRKRRELLESLSLYYRAMVLHENVADFLEEDEEGEVDE